MDVGPGFESWLINIISILTLYHFKMLFQSALDKNENSIDLKKKKNKTGNTEKIWSNWNSHILLLGI